MRSYLKKNRNSIHGIHANVDQSVCHIISYLNQSVCHIAISNSNMDFAFHGIHATFFNTNSYVYDEHHGSEKTFGWIQTYDLQNSTTNRVNVNFSKPSMARIRNNYPYAWSSFQILQCNRIETSILSLVLSTFKCCFQPPPLGTHATYFLYRSIFLS